jgi:hypothetical protein
MSLEKPNLWCCLNFHCILFLSRLAQTGKPCLLPDPRLIDGMRSSSSVLHLFPYPQTPDAHIYTPPIHIVPGRSQVSISSPASILNSAPPHAHRPLLTTPQSYPPSAWRACPICPVVDYQQP